MPKVHRVARSRRARLNQKNKSANVRRLSLEPLEGRALLAVVATVSDGQVVEPEFGSANMDFTVTLSEPSSSVIILNYMTTGYTATPGSDYDLNAGTLTFQPGETERTISIPVFDDLPQETDEQFYLTLSNPGAGILEFLGDANPGLTASEPFGFTEFNGDVYFTATDEDHGRELWKYDGNSVSLVADINTGPADSSPSYLTVWNGALYFSALRREVGIGFNGEIWRYDGASATQVTNFTAPGGFENQPRELIVYKNELYFVTMYDFNGSDAIFKLRADHTTQQIINVNPTAGDEPGWLTVYKDLLVFRANSSSALEGDREMWTYNGVSLKEYDVLEGASSNAALFTEMNGILYFTATGFGPGGPYLGRELWQFDGTQVSVAADMRPGFASSSPEKLVAYNNALYFVARGDADDVARFWKFDATGAHRVMDDVPQTAAPGTYAVFNNELYFAVNDPFTGPGLGRFDGSRLTVAYDLEIGNPLANYSLRTIGNQLYFRAHDDAYGAEAWRITPEVIFADGLAVGTIIDPVNSAPIAANDNITIEEDTNHTGTLPATDDDGDPLTFEIVDEPPVGFLDARPDGSYTYFTRADFNGEVSFTFRANDGTADSNLGKVTIKVTGINDAPRPHGDQGFTNEDTPVTDRVTATDAEGDPLTFHVSVEPNHGTLDLREDGQYTYTPDPDFHGLDGFQFVVSDGQLTSNPSGSSITVFAVNDAPVADDYVVTTDEDTPVVGQVTGSDVDSGPLRFEVFVGPAHGELVFDDDGTYTYTPADDYFGSDSFTFVANDGALVSEAATIDIEVAPVNDAPVAEGSELATAEDTPVSGQATASDIDGASLNFELVAGPAHGGLTFAGDGSFTYTPAKNYFGSDSFTFVANDGALDSEAATIDIEVAPVNDAPVAENDSVSGKEDINLAIGALANDTDVEGSPLTPQIVSGPSHGTLAFSGGVYLYNPHTDYFGTDSFTYRVSDGQAMSNTATVSISLASQIETPSIVVSPGANPGVINLQTATIAVAILSSDAFDAVNQIDVARLTFGKTGNEQSLSVHKRNGPEFEIRDVNGDGRLDVVVYFNTKLTGLKVGDTAALLKGTLKDSSQFAATALVTIKNGKK